MSSLKNAWFVALPASRLAEREPSSAQLLGQNLVIYRDAQGKPQALEDRCCHRGVQLSLGRVTKEGHIACGYHGWEYDGTGRCVHVPSLCTGTPIPKGFLVRAFHCVEQDFYIWVWMGTGEPDTPLPPKIKDIGLHPWRQGTVHCACSAELLADNILDASHVPFVHKGTHPAYFFNRINGFVEYDYEVRITERGVMVFYPPTANADDPFPEDTVASYQHFELPDRVYVFQRGSKNHFHLVLHLVRETPTTSRIEWLMVDLKGEPGTVVWDDSHNTTLNQDRMILESAQKNHDITGLEGERSVPADFPQLLLRKAVALASDDEWESRRHELPQRKLVRVRQ